MNPLLTSKPTQVAQAAASKILYLVSWNFISLFSFNFLYMWFFRGLGGIVQVNMKLLFVLLILSDKAYQILKCTVLANSFTYSRDSPTLEALEQ